MPAVDTTAPESAIGVIPAQSYPQIPLNWSGGDANGVALPHPNSNF